MFDSILEYIVVVIEAFLKNFVNIITKPLLYAIRLFVPNVSYHLVYASSFINTYIFKGVKFFKMFFINICGVSHDVFNLYVFSFGLILFLTFSFLAVKLAYNVYRIIHGTQKGT